MQYNGKNQKINRNEQPKRNGNEVQPILKLCNEYILQSKGKHWSTKPTTRTESSYECGATVKNRILSFLLPCITKRTKKNRKIPKKCQEDEFFLRKKNNIVITLNEKFWSNILPSYVCARCAAMIKHGRHREKVEKMYHLENHERNEQIKMPKVTAHPNLIVHEHKFNQIYILLCTFWHLLAIAIIKC